MMFVFLCRRLALYHRNFTLLDSNTQLGIFRFQAFFSVRCLSSDISPPSNEEFSFPVSYLINEFGFSPKDATTVSKRAKFKSPEKPDSVRGFLRDNGFSDIQISIAVRRKPELLVADPNKTLLPKIEFLRSIGVTREVLPKIITKSPNFLFRSLKEHIIPFYDVLKSVLSDDKVIRALQRISPINLSHASNYLAVNMSVLRRLGVREPIISQFLSRHPNDFCQKADKFNGAVEKVLGMGFDPAKYAFVCALRVQIGLSPKTWEAGIDVFRRWGLSEDQFWLAFRKNQLWMWSSAEITNKKINFLVNKMGWEPEVVVSMPKFLAFSLEKRIVPRFSVIRILQLKGLIKEEISSSQIICTSNDRFLSSFVNKHLEKAPQLLDVLQGKMDIAELGFEFHKKGKASVMYHPPEG